MTIHPREKHDCRPADLAAWKHDLRHAAFQRRRTVTTDQLDEAGRALKRQTMRYIHALNPGTTLAAYVSMGHEIPTTPTLDNWHDQGFPVLVPKLGTGMDIGWGRYAGSDDLTASGRTASGRTRPQEPAGTTLGPDALALAEVILVPALAVDSRHIRLGRGAGWYDRALLHRSSTALVIAVCWPWELTDENLPADTHDVPVDEVIHLD